MHGEGGGSHAIYNIPLISQEKPLPIIAWLYSRSFVFAKSALGFMSPPPPMKVWLPDMLELEVCQLSKVDKRPKSKAFYIHLAISNPLLSFASACAQVNEMQPCDGYTMEDYGIGHQPSNLDINISCHSLI